MLLVRLVQRLCISHINNYIVRLYRVVIVTSKYCKKENQYSTDYNHVQNTKTPLNNIN